MRWLYELFFLGKLSRLFKKIENPTPTLVQDLEPYPRVLEETELEPEFHFLCELLESQFLTDVTINPVMRGREILIEVEGEQIASVSLHKRKRVVVRMHTTHRALQAWFRLAFLRYNVSIQLLKPEEAKRRGKTPRGH